MLLLLCSKTYYGSPLPRKQSLKSSGRAGRASVWNVLYNLPWVYPSGYTLPESPRHGLPSSFLSLHFKPNPHPPPPWRLFYLHPTASLSSGPLKCLPAIPFPSTEVLPTTKLPEPHWILFRCRREKTFLCSWWSPLEFGSPPIFRKMKCWTPSMPTVYILPARVSTDIVTSRFYWAAPSVIDDICWGWYFKWRLFSVLPLPTAHPTPLHPSSGSK